MTRFKGKHRQFLSLSSNFIHKISAVKALKLPHISSLIQTVGLESIQTLLNLRYFCLILLLMPNRLCILRRVGVISCTASAYTHLACGKSSILSYGVVVFFIIRHCICKIVTSYVHMNGLRYYAPFN